MTLPTDCTERESGALPGRSRGAENFFDIHDFDLFAELLSVDPITNSQQIFRCCVEGKGFEHLLRGPFGRGMTCHVKVDDTSAIMREHDVLSKSNSTGIPDDASR